jgi:hypothetical protein
VLVGALPNELRNAAEMYAGCVSGAIQKQVYLELIQACGFINIVLQKEKPIVIPNDILKNYLSDSEIEKFNLSDLGIFSVTVYAEKPAATCAPGSGCC